MSTVMWNSVGVVMFGTLSLVLAQFDAATSIDPSRSDVFTELLVSKARLKAIESLSCCVGYVIYVLIS